MVAKVEAIQSDLRARVADLLGIAPNAVDMRKRFSDYGLTSGMALDLLARLSRELGQTLPSTLAWDFPSIEALARHLAGGKSDPAMTEVAEAVDAHGTEPIAVVGLACRFPGAPDADAFWRLLCDEGDAIREVPPERWNADTYYDVDRSAPGKMNTRWGGFLDAIDRFDPAPFGISPREAAQIDPQQRLMLELAWEALEDASIASDRLRDSRTGVFCGAMTQDYARMLENGAALINEYSATGQDTSIIAARISYTFGLQGPSLVVNTACSSSLVAVHLACQSLQRGESTLALAGGVNALLVPESTVAMTKFGGMSPDGRSKAFDARANGYVRAEGGGIVVLKRLSRALADGDRIWCVIRGSAVNNDGFSNGLTAPNPRAQEGMLHDAYRRASVPVHAVQFVEAHGTGTMLGDPIEAKALGAVLGAGRSPEQPLRVGSVKTNIGHLEAAAGIAGLIKVALCIRHQELPRNLHFERPNPHIPFAELGLRVQDARTAWPRPDDPLIAGVSSFGFGGTNCHVVVSEPPVRPVYLLSLSGATEGELRERADTLARLSSDRNTSLPRLCAAAGADLSAERFRAAVVARTREHLADGLAAVRRGEADVIERPESGSAPRIAFVFSGNGSQWRGMGRQLVHASPIFRARIAACDQVMKGLWERSLLDELCAEPAADQELPVHVEQALLFAMQHGLAALWRSWNIEPDAVVGHSLGEVAAACVAGILDLEDAAQIVMYRSRLQGALAGQGAMTLAACPPSDLEELLAERRADLAIAAVNAPNATVLSGSPAAIASATAALEARGVACRRMRVNVAYHSPQMDPLRDELPKLVSGITPRAARVPMMSTVTADWCDGVSLGPEYWGENLRQPVLFAQAIDRLLRDGYRVFLEVSPHPILVESLRAGAAGVTPAAEVLGSLHRGRDAQEALMTSLAALYLGGRDVRWDRVHVPAAPPPHLPASSSVSAPRAIEVKRADDADGAALLPLSAHSPAALAALAGQVASWLDSQADGSLRDLCFTASTRRAHRSHRVAAVASSRREMVDRLQAFARSEIAPGVVQGKEETAKNGPVFVFPGQGCQWAGMGRQLLAQETVFRDALEACDRAMRAHVPWSVVELVASGREPQGIDEVQPAIFAVQVALAALWRSLGIVPEAVIGQSMGEVAAAHIAGALELSDAVQVICRRSRLLRRIRGRGAMAMVALPLSEAELILQGHAHALGIAVSSSPASTVIAGDPTALNEVLSRLKERGVYCQPIHVDVASHSPQVDIVLDDLRAELRDIRPRAPKIPMYSTVSGEVLVEAACDAEYWVRNLRQPVRFSESVQRLIAEGHDVFLEISPHPVVLRSVEDGLRHAGRAGLTLPSTRRDHDERTELLQSLGTLYAYGRPVLWSQLYPDGGYLVRLPPYPWDRRSFWIDTKRRPRRAGQRDGDHPLLGTPLPELAAFRGSRFWERSGETGTDDVRVLAGSSGVLGASACCSLAEAAARAAGLTGRLAFDACAFHAPRAGGEGALTLQFAWTPSGADAGSFQVFAREGDSEDRTNWRLVASMRVREAADGLAVAPGEVLARVEGLTWQSLDQRVHDPGNVPDGWAYELAWQPLAAARAHAAESVHAAAGTWILCADHGGVAAALAHAIAACGGRPVLLAAHADGDVGPSHGAPARPSLEGSLSAAIHAAGDLRGVIHLGALDLPAPSDREASGLLENAIVAVTGAARLVKDMLHEPGALTSTPRIWLVTRGVQPAAAGAVSRHGLAQAPLWGMGRVAALEHPEVWGGLVDLDPNRDAAEQAVDLLDAVLEGKDEDQLALRGRARFAPRLMPLRLDRLQRSPVALRRDGTYLITGGLGMIGTALAHWLVDRGVRHLLLLGRSNQDVGAERLAALSARGVEVLYMRADVADATRMAEVLSEAERTMPTLRGVFHAAGALSHARLVAPDGDHARSMLAPKVAGAWILHRLTEHLPLDLFVMFSSAAAVWGSMGQAHYAAANHALDTLAHYRHGLGLPSLSVNWGLWAGEGLGSKEAGQFFADVGLMAMDPMLAFACLERLVSSGAVQATVAAVDWKKFKPTYEARRRRPLLSAIHADEASARPAVGSGGAATDFVRKLNAAPESQRLELLRGHVGELVADVLGLGASDSILPHDGFFRIGMSSLTAVQLARRLQDSLGRRLPSTVTFDYPNVDALSEYLATSVLGLAGAAPQPQRQPRLEQPFQPVAVSDAPPEDMSESELLELISQRLSRAP